MRKISMFLSCMLCAGIACAQDAASFQKEIAEKAKGLEIVGEDLCEQFNLLRNPGEPPFTLSREGE